MTPAAIAQLLIILAPLVKSAVVEGGKVIAEFKADITQEDINKALQASWNGDVMKSVIIF